MTDAKDRENDVEGRTESAEAGREDDARRIILARRARFVAAALASAGIATASCGGETSGGGSPEQCLSIGAAGGQYNDGGTGGAQATTGGRQTGSGGMPMPCLSPPQGGTVGYGGSPQPCLDIDPGGAGGADGAGGAVPDSGTPDAADADPAGPMPCLRIPASDRDEGAGS